MCTSPFSSRYMVSSAMVSVLWSARMMCVCFFFLLLLPMSWCSWVIFFCISFVVFNEFVFTVEHNQNHWLNVKMRTLVPFSYGILDQFILGYFLLLVSFAIFILFGNAVERKGEKKFIGSFCVYVKTLPLRILPSRL